MKKVTQQAIRKFLDAQPFKSGNTQVHVLPNVTVLSLHGNEIAYKYNNPENTVSICACGWLSNTTKERLNGIPGVSIHQKNYQWYLNGQKWDGQLIDVK
jgi:hypothetical protein